MQKRLEPALLRRVKGGHVVGGAVCERHENPDYAARGDVTTHAVSGRRTRLSARRVPCGKRRFKRWRGLADVVK